MTGGNARPGSGARKLIHLGLSVGAAAVIWLLPPLAGTTVLAVAAAIALAVELARRVSPGIARRFRLAVGSMLKPGEERRLTGATTLAVGFTVVAVVLPGTPALAGILFAGAGDAAAAAAGQGSRYRYPGGKSIAGSGAFVAVAWAIGLFLGLTIPVALMAAILAAAAEALTLGIDDNLYLPLAGGLAVHLASWLAGM